MYKMTIQVPGGTMEVPGDSLEAVIKAASFLQNLPFVCPVDGTPTRLSYRKAGGYDYYGLVSTGAAVYTYPFGRPLEKGDGEFFEGKVVKAGKETSTRRQWCYYDHDKQEQIVLWEDGRLTAEGRKRQAGLRQAQPPTPEASTVSSAEPLVEGGLPPWEGGTDGAEGDVAVLQATAAMAGAGMDDGALLARRKTFNLAGREVYGEAWPDKCGPIIQWFTDNQISDPDRLTVAQLDGLIIKLRSKKAKK